jgi:uncharacterized small protein (DUF1192 family)
VLERREDGWWLGEARSTTRGIFPGSYVQLIPDTEDSYKMDNTRQANQLISPTTDQVVVRNAVMGGSEDGGARADNAEQQIKAGIEAAAARKANQIHAPALAAAHVTNAPVEVKGHTLGHSRGGDNRTGERSEAAVKGYGGEGGQRVLDLKSVLSERDARIALLEAQVKSLQHQLARAQSGQHKVV